MSARQFVEVVQRSHRRFARRGRNIGNPTPRLCSAQARCSATCSRSNRTDCPPSLVLRCRRQWPLLGKVIEAGERPKWVNTRPDVDERTGRLILRRRTGTRQARHFQRSTISRIFQTPCIVFDLAGQGPTFLSSPTRHAPRSPHLLNGAVPAARAGDQFTCKSPPQCARRQASAAGRCNAFREGRPFTIFTRKRRNAARGSAALPRCRHSARSRRCRLGTPRCRSRSCRRWRRTPSRQTTCPSPKP
jgi:hypothetical protein